MFNDFVGLLSLVDVMVIDRVLIEFSWMIGVQGMVVILFDWVCYGGVDGFEFFVMWFFNYWGVGNVQCNDGFMLLVLCDDCEVWIELGWGYLFEVDILVQDIMCGMLLFVMCGDVLLYGICQMIEDIICLIVCLVVVGVLLVCECLDGWVGLVIFGVFGVIFVVIVCKVWMWWCCFECSCSGVIIMCQLYCEVQFDGGYLVVQQEIIWCCLYCGWYQICLLFNLQMMWYGVIGEFLCQ